MTTKKPPRRVAGKPQPATTEKSHQPDRSGIRDRKAATGGRYADGRKGAAEGNDPSLTAGRTITRKVRRNDE